MQRKVRKFLNKDSEVGGGGGDGKAAAASVWEKGTDDAFRPWEGWEGEKVLRCVFPNAGKKGLGWGRSL